MNILDLKPVPNKEWETEFTNVMKDKYVSKKYHSNYRKERFQELVKYVEKYLPEVKKSELNPPTSLRVLDIGPGMGEFLELLRSYGHEAVGIDAPLDGSEMGQEYMQMARLMTSRQGLNVLYEDFGSWIENGFPVRNLDVVNSQGSLDQVLKHFLLGEPHSIHKVSTRLAWDLKNPELAEYILKMFNKTLDVLNPNGIFIIYFNGASNQHKFSEFFRTLIADKVPDFKLVQSDPSRLFKFKKEIK